MESAPTSPPLKIRMLKSLLEKAEKAPGAAKQTWWVWVVGFVSIAPPGSALDTALSSVLALIL